MLKPALNTILKPGKEYDELCDAMVSNFNVTLDRVRRQVNDKKAKKKKRGPILPGSNKSFELRYFCTVCKESFEIPPEMKTLMDNSSEKIELPEHHDKEMSNIHLSKLTSQYQGSLLFCVGMYDGPRPFFSRSELFY